MKAEDIKILMFAGILGVSVGVATILYNYFSTTTSNNNNNNNGLKSFETNETNSPTNPLNNIIGSSNNNNNNNNNNINNDFDIEDLNKKCGFCRPEIIDSNRKSVTNSIREYDRHFFLCTGIPHNEWLDKYFAATPFLESIQATIKKHKLPFIFNGIDMKSTKSSSSSSNSESIDILVFPEMIKLIDMNADSLNSLLEFYENNQNPSIDQYPSNIKIEVLNNKFIFVCAHKSKDERCGYCGPILMDELKKEIEKRSLSKEINVFGSTHVGGHKYAGNALVFPPGHWYGYVTPNDVNSIIDSTVSGELYKPLHRGTMGEKMETDEQQQQSKKDHHHKKDHKQN